MAIKERITKMEAQAAPLLVSAWFERELNDPQTDARLLDCLTGLVLAGVVTKPLPHVWQKFDARFNLSHLSDQELDDLEAQTEADRASMASNVAILLFETFQQVPAPVLAPDAGKHFDDYLRCYLAPVRGDLENWEGAAIRRMVAAADAALIAKGQTSENDALEFFRSYQP